MGFTEAAPDLNMHALAITSQLTGKRHGKLANGKEILQQHWAHALTQQRTRAIHHPKNIAPVYLIQHFAVNCSLSLHNYKYANASVESRAYKFSAK